MIVSLSEWPRPKPLSNPTNSTLIGPSPGRSPTGPSGGPGISGVEVGPFVSELGVGVGRVGTTGLVPGAGVLFGSGSSGGGVRSGLNVGPGPRLGSAGSSATQGFVTDVSAGAITHDSPVGVQFRGGPLLNSDGKVTGVASAAYAPFGFSSPTGVSFASPIRTSCERLLRCPAGNNTGGNAAARV